MPMREPGLRTTARSMTFSSSRTLPGQSYSVSRSSASGVNSRSRFRFSSPYESLSLLALEALSVGTPILVNARSSVLVEHAKRSNGGLWYADRDEFVEALKLLVGDEPLRRALGRNGREYVRRGYRWDVVLGKYERLFAKIRNAR